MQQIHFLLAGTIVNNDITTAVSCNNRFARRREQMTNVDGHFTIDYVSNFLGRADLRERMAADGIIDADGMPTAQHANTFAVVETDDGLPEVLVTPDGAVALLHHYGIAGDERITHQTALAIQ
ncbi:hypothetical protein [Paraburkholderia sp. C35]|uniref:hypothetical protein n=1 Tax=Paraburkholderia sp. C35 TaxID=2126993 RepID=UPI0013A58F56|nr:hypothetical protein [Paraburkholderia sp. C35]